MPWDRGETQTRWDWWLGTPRRAEGEAQDGQATVALLLVHLVRLLKVIIVILVLVLVRWVLRRGLGVVNDHAARAAPDHVVEVDPLPAQVVAVVVVI